LDLTAAKFVIGTNRTASDVRSLVATATFETCRRILKKSAFGEGRKLSAHGQSDAIDPISEIAVAEILDLLKRV
jgi:hypothetical protein